MTPKIDKEFEALLPRLSEEEFNLLKQSIETEGIRDPLIVWSGQGILLDGHNRFRICGGKGGEFSVKEIRMKDRHAAIDWIIGNQLARRNLHPNHYAYYLGKRYDEEKKAHGGDRKSSPQNEDLKGRASEKLSNNSGKSKATIERNAEFARGVDALDQAIPGTKSKILNGKSNLTKGDIQRVARAGATLLEKPGVKESLTRKIEGKAKPEEENEIERMLRENEKKPYPWKDLMGLNAIIDGVESLRKIPIKRIKEYLTQSPTGRDYAKNNSITKAADFLKSLSLKL